VTLERLEGEQVAHRRLGGVFDFFARAENLGRITSPWLSFRVLTPGPIEMDLRRLIDDRRAAVARLLG
jgi:hypothetical protein